MAKAGYPKKKHRQPPPAKRPEPESGPSPWPPMAIFGWTLLNGPLFGGVWAAMNARRLDRGSATAPYYLMALVGQASPWIVNRLILHVPPAHPAAFSWVFAFNVVAAYYYLFAQREAFWDHQDRGGRRSSLVWPSVIGMVVFLGLVLGRVLAGGE